MDNSNKEISYWCSYVWAVFDELDPLSAGTDKYTNDVFSIVAEKFDTTPINVCSIWSNEQLKNYSGIS